ncbi:MAG: alanine racemase [Flavobacteriaceae bacterium]|nr:MAG: alanine racemase [Flavobacteriaceae bacterium]
MNRKKFLATLGVLGLGAYTLYHNRAQGEPYSEYFHALNEKLKSEGSYKPSLIIDMDILDKNIEVLKSNLTVDYRIVVKSIPSANLVKYIMEKTSTKKLMMFHQPFINHMAKLVPDSDILLGKPMPVKAAEIFYKDLEGSFDPTTQLQWLVDTKERLVQYLELSKKIGKKMLISLEIDVNMHRCNIREPEQLDELFAIFKANPQHIVFNGFMGYDGHVTNVPSFLEAPEKTYEKSITRYEEFIAYTKKNHSEFWREDLCLNGGGSPSITFHKDGRCINDVSASSCLVKAYQFDKDVLAEFQPACFIATPILKIMDGLNLPSLDFATKPLKFLAPNASKTYFTYGGKWMAKFESPKGLSKSEAYGESTNQCIACGDEKQNLKVDDYIFLRPYQSEFVFLQFGALNLYRKGKPLERWDVLGQESNPDIISPTTPTV